MNFPKSIQSKFKAKITDGGSILNFKGTDYKIVSVTAKGITVEDYAMNNGSEVQIYTLFDFSQIV